MMIQWSCLELEQIQPRTMKMNTNEWNARESTLNMINAKWNRRMKV